MCFSTLIILDGFKKPGAVRMLGGWCSPRKVTRPQSRTRTHPGSPLDEAGQDFGFSLFSLATSLKLSVDGPDEVSYVDTAPGLFFTHNTAAVEEYSSELHRCSDGTLASWMLAGDLGENHRVSRPRSRREYQGEWVEPNSPTACAQLDQHVAKLLEKEQRKEKLLFDVLAEEKQKLAQTRESLKEPETSESSREHQQDIASAQDIHTMKRLLWARDKELEAMQLKINDLQTRLQKSEAATTVAPVTFQSHSRPSQQRSHPPPVTPSPSTVTPRVVRYNVRNVTHVIKEQAASVPAVDVRMARGRKAHDPNVNIIEQRNSSSSSLR